MKKIIGLTLCLTFIIFACKKHNEETKNHFTKEKISGVSQKGPFVNGSSLTLFELNESFSQTGKSFNAQILDNLGSFEINNIDIQTSFAKLKADGYYYNEINNANSNSSITLYAISDLTNKSTININLISTLEVSRVEYLINNGLSFSAAKNQAQQEILNMFFIHKPIMAESELLDISVNGDDNAILLAISMILQGYRTEAELSQLLGDISTDIRIDGILNSSTIGSELINGAKLFDTTQIRNNIESKYSSLGITTVIPHFEKYIQQFLDSNTYTFTNYITFPGNGNYGVNLLNNSDSILPTGYNYSFCANLPTGTSLIIKLYGYMSIGYSVGTLDGWTDLGSDSALVWKTYASNRTGLIDFHASYHGNTIIYFYENGSLIPTRIKNLYVQ